METTSPESLASKAGRLEGCKGKLAALLLGFVALLLLEGVLRAVGYRDDLRFITFVPESKIFQQNNGTVSLFPERTKDHQFRTKSFPAVKPKGTIRIFCVGDSVTLGWHLKMPGGTIVIEKPYPDMLEEKLNKAFPSLNFEVLNCGGSGHASYRLKCVVDEILDYQPDIVTVMFGSSEFSEARYYKDWSDRKWLYGNWIMRSKILMLMRDLLRLSNHIFAGRSYNRISETRPVDMADHLPINYDDATKGEDEMSGMLEQAGHNLDQMISACLDRGVSIIVCTEASNLRHRPWDETRPRTAKNPADRLFWDTLGSLDELRGKQMYSETAQVALDAIRKLPAWHAGIPHLYYLRGCALENAGRLGEAKEAYIAARDSETFPVRNTTRLNRIIKDTASRRGVKLLDIERVVEKAVPDGIPDDRIFLDRMHFNEEGHKIVTPVFYDAITNVLESRKVALKMQL